MFRHCWTIQFAAAVLLFSLVLPVEAQTTNWKLPAGQLDDWSTSSNWSSSEPTSSTNAYITNGGTATVSLAGETCRGLYVGNSSTLQMTDGSL